MTNIVKNLVIGVLVLVVAFLGFQYFGGGSDIPSGGLSKQEAVDKSISFINEQMLQPGVEATLVGEVGDLSERGLYEFLITVAGEELTVYITTDGKVFFPQGIDIDEAIKQAENVATPIATPIGGTIGNFIINDEEVCVENNLPLVYFFGSETCPFCQWEHPIMEKVAEEFNGLISFHNNMDTGEDQDVFARFSTGNIPTVVLGCKYSRIGAGQDDGEEVETNNLRALICDLTDGLPSDVCDGVADLINQTNE